MVLKLFSYAGFFFRDCCIVLLVPLFLVFAIVRGGVAFLLTLYLVFGTAVVLQLIYNYLVTLFWFMVSRGYYSYFGNAVLGVW